MKRIQLFAIIGLLAVGIQAQTYHPFVEAGKKWRVHGFSVKGNTVFDYCFPESEEYIYHDGHEYAKCLGSRDNHLPEVGELREEDRRVYFYDTANDKEDIIYDFSLEVGDTFQDTRYYITFTVDSTGQMIVNGDTLKTLHLSTLNGELMADWVEGIGNINSPMGIYYSDTPNSWSYRVAYVSGSSYWPFSFSIPNNGWWGQTLKTIVPKDVYEKYEWNQQQENLNYEMVYNVVSNTYDLHVSGFMDMNCGPNHYIYCIDEQTADSNIHRITLQHEDVPPLMDCEGGHKVDFVISGFNKDCTYTVVDERGEHPVAVRDVSYRPFIEEGKVWRTGVTFPNISFSHLYDYYIQGDTIIDNHACKKLMRSELQYPQNYPEHIDTTYAASLYEEGQRVYVVLPGESHLELAYDFASPVGSHIDIDGFNIIVTRKEEKATGCFKGRCTYVGLEEEYEDISFESCWIEGVGVALNPLYSLNELLPTGLLKELLIFCFVNDEVLYYNSDIFDGDIYGVTPEGADVKKHWIDFTHIKKPRPKAPARERTANETDEENLTGEYSAHELFVNLKILSGTYAVTLKDAADNEVYRRDVQTSSTIALTTDLTKYPAGTYTLVVENSEEQYTATLTLPLDDTAVRDLPSIVNCKLSNCKWYDLSGRQLSTPPAKGVYIRDGRKVVVK